MKEIEKFSDELHEKQKEQEQQAARDFDSSYTEETNPSSFVDDSLNWTLRMNGASTDYAQFIIDNIDDYTVDENLLPVYSGKTPFKGEKEGSKLDELDELDKLIPNIRR